MSTGTKQDGTLRSRAKRCLPAPWWRRVAAEVTDLIIIMLLTAVFLWLGGAHPYWAGRRWATWEETYKYVAVVAASLIYLPAVLWLADRRTVGKVLWGLEVQDRSGARIGYVQALWRELFAKTAVFDLIALLPGVSAAAVTILELADVLWPLGNHEHLALHDLLARSRVVVVRYGDTYDPVSATAGATRPAGTT
jgi:uncharacterized RDD family membrane protein YckC